MSLPRVCEGPFIENNFFKRLEQIVIAGGHLSRYFIGNFLVVGVRCLVAALEHLHPPLAIVDQVSSKSFAGRVTGTRDRGISLIFEVILHDVPGQLMGELEGLDQPQLFDLRQGPLPAQFHRSGELLKRLLVVTEALLRMSCWSMYFILPTFHGCRNARLSPGPPG